MVLIKILSIFLLLLHIQPDIVDGVSCGVAYNRKVIDWKSVDASLVDVALQTVTVVHLEPIRAEEPLQRRPDAQCLRKQTRSRTELLAGHLQLFLLQRARLLITQCSEVPEVPSHDSRLPGENTTASEHLRWNNREHILQLSKAIQPLFVLLLQDAGGG